ncbi:hypothetical protein REPUB_Repub15cG0110400 [Reevesia pubescens]
MALPIPTIHLNEDRSFWGFTANGHFSTSSAYDVVSLLNDRDDLHEEDMRWIWHLQCPERMRFFIWLLFQNKLNTNEIRLKKNIVTSADCGLCSGFVESSEHLFRSCSFATQVWQKTRSQLSSNAHFDQPFNIWLTLNCNSSSGDTHDLPWATLFSCMLWSLWKTRNRRIFDGKVSDVAVTFSYAIKLCRDIHSAWWKRQDNITRLPKWISWSPPPHNVFALNTDGTRNNSSGVSAVGGLIRNTGGNWICGFLSKIGRTNVQTAELWGVREGLHLAMEMGLQHLIIQVDAAAIIPLLQDITIHNNHPSASILQDCHAMISYFNSVQVQHVYREGNRCADKLANLALMDSVSHGTTVLSSPPSELVTFLKSDAEGVSFLRL